MYEFGENISFFYLRANLTSHAITSVCGLLPYSLLVGLCLLNLMQSLTSHFTIVSNKVLWIKRIRKIPEDTE